MALPIQEANVRAVLSIAVSQNKSMQQAVDNYADPLTEQERKLLLSISPDELKALREIELKIKAVTQSSRSIWGGVVW